MKKHEKKAIQRAIDTLFNRGKKINPYRVVELAQLRAHRVYDPITYREAIEYIKKQLN